MIGAVARGDGYGQEGSSIRPPLVDNKEADSRIPRENINMRAKCLLASLMATAFFLSAYSEDSTKKFIEFPEMKSAAEQLSKLMKEESVSPDETISQEMTLVTRRYLYWGEKPPRQRLEADLSDWTKILSSLPGQLPEIGEFLKKRKGRLDDLSDAQIVLAHRMVEMLLFKLESFVRD
jgi:hypothetical protein